MSGSHAQALTAGPLAGEGDSPIHRLDPRAKIAGMLAVVLVAISVSPAGWPVWAACAAVLAAIALLARPGAATIWRRALLALPVVVLVAVTLPFVRSGGESVAIGPLTAHQQGVEAMASVLAKSAIGIAASILLVATTSFPSTVRGLEAMRVPRLLTVIAALTYRYAFVIGDEVGRMRTAMAARAYRPRSLLHVGSTGRAATALFLRAYARGERVHMAMLARGYSGRLPQLEPLRLGRAEALFALALVLALVPVRIWAGG